jgi:hypothetical protein
MINAYHFISKFKIKHARKDCGERGVSVQKRRGQERIHQCIYVHIMADCKKTILCEFANMNILVNRKKIGYYLK